MSIDYLKTLEEPQKIGSVNFPVMTRAGSAGLVRQPHPNY